MILPLACPFEIVGKVSGKSSSVISLFTVSERVEGFKSVAIRFQKNSYGRKQPSML